MGMARWTEAMDAALTALRGAGHSYRQIAARMAEQGFGVRSHAAVQQRAYVLGIDAARLAEEKRPRCREDEGPLDCRAANGRDPLLAAMRARHFAPPADAVPSAGDARPLAWRRLLPEAGCAGSPGAQCAELGSRTTW